MPFGCGTAVPDPGRMPDLVLPVPAGMAAGMAVAVPAAAGLAAADWAVVLVVALLAAAPPLLCPTVAAKSSSVWNRCSTILQFIIFTPFLPNFIGLFSFIIQ